MRTLTDTTVVSAVVGPLVLWACIDVSFLHAIGISGLMLAPAALMDGCRLYRAHKARTAPVPDYKARITIPLEVLACTRAPTSHEQVELIRRLREAQEQLIQLSAGK